MTPEQYTAWLDLTARAGKCLQLQAVRVIPIPTDDRLQTDHKQGGAWP